MSDRAWWSEVIVRVERLPHERLLLEHILPLVESLRPRLRTWHYFWEPDLHLRLGWTSEHHKRAGDEDVEAVLADLDGVDGVEGWSFGAYEGDARIYGREIWEAVERDFEHGSELATTVVRHDHDETLSKDRDFHWARHMHTFTNQLKGSWGEEARLCVRQARYRARLLRGGTREHGAELDALLDKLDAVMEDIHHVAEAERELLARWRAEGRPDLGGMLALPPDFHRDPGR